MNELIFNGVSSLSLGLFIENTPNIYRPTKRISSFSVPGRNGDIVIEEGAADNYEQEYKVAVISRPRGSLQDVFTPISDWLLSATGYCRLEDTYDENHYRMAYFRGPIDVRSVLKNAGRTTLKFICKPQRFLKSGEASFVITSTSSIYNPTPFEAKPLIVVHGSGNGTITAGGNTITITQITDGMILDSEDQQAFYGSTLLNEKISGEFPVLTGGDNEILFTGGITSLEIIPNFWRY